MDFFQIDGSDDLSQGTYDHSDEDIWGVLSATRSAALNQGHCRPTDATAKFKGSVPAVNTCEHTDHLLRVHVRKGDCSPMLPLVRKDRCKYPWRRSPCSHKLHVGWGVGNGGSSRSTGKECCISIRLLPVSCRDNALDQPAWLRYRMGTRAALTPSACSKYATHCAAAAVRRGRFAWTGPSLTRAMPDLPGLERQDACASVKQGSSGTSQAGAGPRASMLARRSHASTPACACGARECSCATRSLTSDAMQAPLS